MIVHLELIVGKELLDADGRCAGRIVEVHGDDKGKDFVISHYAIVTGYHGFLLHELGFEREKRHVPWDKVDLSDPLKPRLLCSVDELTTRPPAKRRGRK
jgi:hypothetical protein